MVVLDAKLSLITNIVSKNVTQIVTVNQFFVRVKSPIAYPFRRAGVPRIALYTRWTLLDNHISK